MQRRLQMGAVCFATTTMLLIAVTADLLRSAGLLPMLSFGWEGYFAFTFFLYSFGLVWAHRHVR